MTLKTENTIQKIFAFALTAAIPLGGLAIAQNISFDGRPVIVLINDKIELTVLTPGATLANLTLPIPKS